MQTSAAVSALSLESYVQLFKALTKGTGTVQPVTPIEECYYKISDLRQLLVVHGMSTGKFNRCELLQALKGKALINPFSISHQATGSNHRSGQSHPTTGQPAAQPCGDVSSMVPFSAADIASLGWAEAGDILAQPLEQLQLKYVPGPADMQLPTACSPPLRVGTAALAAAAAPQPPQPAAAANPCSGEAALSPAEPTHPAAGASSSKAQVILPAGILLPQVLLVPAAAAAATGGGTTSERAAAGASNDSNTCNTAAAPAGVPAPGNGSSIVTTTAKQQAPSLAKKQQAGSSVVQKAAPAAAASTATENMLPPHTATFPALGTIPSSAGAEQTVGHSSLNAAEQQQQQQMSDSKAASNQEVVRLLQHAGLHQPSLVPGHGHTSWLLQQLQQFAVRGAVPSKEQLHGAAAAAVPGAGSGGVLLGRHVGFVLMEDMQVAGARNTVQTLPAGVYEGHAVKYLGSSCQPELCEVDCPGNHQHYRARIMPPQRLPGQGLQGTLLSSSSDTDAAAAAAAAASQAHAAISGRPVLLILDLHPRLCCRSYQELLALTAEQLQDAWVLLEERDSTPSSPGAGQQPPSKTAAAGGAAAASRRGRPSSSGLPPSKRARP